MRRYILIRIFQGIITLFILVTAVFALVRLTGDPTMLYLGEVATPQQRLELSQKLGLDKPIIVQYGIYVRQVITGDFGESIITKRPVVELIAGRLPNTLRLIGVATLFAFVIGIPLGVMGAVKKGRFLDRLARISAALGQATPIFWLGIMLMMFFSVNLGVLPTSGMGGWQTYIMPGFCLGLFLMAGIIRLLRSSMLDTLDSEFIKMARIKGLPERVVIWKHALRNSLLAVLSFAAIQIALLVTASIAVETVFAWPGLGRLIYTSLMRYDFPVIQGVVLTAAGIIILANLATDVLCAQLDPRIRLETQTV